MLLNIQIFYFARICLLRLWMIRVWLLITTMVWWRLGQSLFARFGVVLVGTGGGTCDEWTV
ncbi:hypothetical protein BE04_10395 [Sorangium cellulosum]|uniref:Uncharacterized protein n=1 Tax=Sorangium cellulosum TaxID=56 RepID=A0A150QB01_SORCE|nr:hypothetical protein BE04_10395 [Sorangium cellulosum]